MDNAAGLSKIFINLKTHASEYAVGEHTSLTERSSKTSGACAGELVDPVHASCAILAGIAFTLIDICLTGKRVKSTSNVVLYGGFTKLRKLN